MAACPKCSKPVPAGALKCTHCNAVLPSDVHDMGPRPKVSMRFDVKALVGIWASQKVYLGRNRSNDDEVCLRLLPPAVGGDEGARERIAALLSRAQALKATPGVVAITGFEVEDGQPYFIQEIAAGTTLADRLKTEKHLVPEEVRRLAVAVADALAAAGGKGIAHGDLKPSSVLLADDGVIRVTDFAVGKVVSDATSKAMAGGGGPKPKVAMYHSPEILRTGVPDARSDLFALGCLMFEAATGDRHFPDGYRRSCGEPHKGYPFRDPLEAHRDFDPALAGIVRKLLAPNPADRFPDIAAAAAALKGGEFPPALLLKAGEAPPPPPVVEEHRVPDFASKPIQRPTKKSKAGPVVLGSILVLGVAGGILWMRHRAPEAPPSLVNVPEELPFVPARPVLLELPVPPDADVRGFDLPERVVALDKRIWSLCDGAELVLVPAGPVMAGRDDGPPDEGPARTFVLSPFLVDRHEVVVGQYKRFCEFTRRSLPVQPEGSTDLHPVVRVTHADAEAYAKWARRRLPTEVEWEKAARGSTGSPYPWGGEDDPSMRNGPGKDDGFEGLAPAGSFLKGQSAYGVLDLAGNAWEWCADVYTPKAYASAPGKDPQGPPNGPDRCIRGGSYLLGGPPLRVTFRHHAPPGTRFDDLGFRCAVSVTEKKR